ncbi:hypothetical protein AAG906_030855 [Vitis piasezkii]
MILRSLQLKIARHVVGVPFIDFGSLVSALYDVDDDILRELWFDSSPIDAKGKKLVGGQRSDYRQRAPPQPYDQTYLPPTLALPPTSYPTLVQPCYATDHCTALRHTMQDLIDQDLVHLGQPSVTTNLLPAHTSHTISPPTSDIHFMDFTKPDDRIHTLSWDDSELEPIVVDESYEFDGVILDPQASTPFRLVPDTPPVQLTIVGSLICPCYSVQSPFILSQDPDETVRISIWSLLASSTSHWEALVRVLGQIRVETSTSPEGLIHMLTADKATCIVFFADDLPPGVSSVLLDNGFALNVCSLAITVALSFGSLEVEPSSQTVRAYDRLHKEVLVVLDMMRSMSFLPGLEFIATVDHDTPFGLSVVPTEADYRYMTLLRNERLELICSMCHLTILFSPYRMSLANYFLQFLVHQFQLSNEAPDTSTFVLVTPPSLDRTSLLTLYFPEKTDEYGTSIEIANMIDGLETASPLNLFGVLAIEMVEDVQLVPTLGLLTVVANDDDVFEGVTSPVMVESEHVNPPLSFDVLFRFVFHSDDIFDIDDEIVQHDSDEDSSSTSIRGVEDWIGLDLPTKERDSLVQLLRSYLDVFAWSYEDMLGLDLSIVQHCLPLLPHVKQEDIQKQLSVGFLLVDVKVRVCVDFQDLHKAIDSMVGYSMLSFMDEFSKYNQILMAPKDMEKTSFIIEWGTYCYRSRSPATLERFFEKIKQFRLRLNPKKCTFGVTSRKLLGYMVNERGMEANPDKIRAILDMLASRTKRQLRGFLGRLQYISRFIAKLTDICEPIFRLLRKSQPISIKWSIVADHLASLLVSDDRAIDDGFPDEDIIAVTSFSDWCMYFDGMTNHSGYGIGVLLISPHGDHIPKSVRLGFSDRQPATNNIVEYEACILGLEIALELEIRQIDVKLRPYHAYLELLVGRFDDLRYTHLPRAQNRFVDALATLAFMFDIPVDTIVCPLLIESRSIPTYCCLIDETELDNGLPWYHDIYQFLGLADILRSLRPRIREH